MWSDNGKRQPAILTIDVEDNFTREELARPDDWDRYEKQVAENTEMVISHLKTLSAHATFFVLGKVAERHPDIVKSITRAGHEVASHGFAHELVRDMSPAEFEDDVKRASDCIEAITNRKVRGFRARSFSITHETMWALEILRKLGFEYDASMRDVELRSLGATGIPEVPISTAFVAGRQVALSGGIALRLLPSPIYLRFLRHSSSFKQCPVIYYHVWEYNTDQPKRKVSFLQSIFQSSLTYTTASKIAALSRYYRFMSIEQYMEEGPQMTDVWK